MLISFRNPTWANLMRRTSHQNLTKMTCVRETENAHATQISNMSAPPQVVDILLQVFDALGLLHSCPPKAAAAAAADSDGTGAAPGRRPSRCRASAAEVQRSSIRRGLGTGCGAAAAARVASARPAPGLEHLLLQLLLHLAQQEAQQLGA